MAMTAKCSCGELSIRANSNPLKVSVCHCKACQRRTGSAFGVAAFYHREDVVADGLSNAEMGERLFVSEHTIKRHVANILGQLDLPPRAAAAARFAGRSAPPGR